MSLKTAATMAVRVSAPVGAAGLSQQASFASCLCRRFSGTPATPSQLVGAGHRLVGTIGGAAGVQFRRHMATKFSSSETDTAQKIPLTKLQAEELVLKLTEEEQKVLMTAIQTFQSEKTRQEYKAETQPAPTSKELANLGLHNALPFIGFGFLDNFIMIVAGDYIDLTIGMTLGISTMAAAALGNTISDVAGIGSAWYVENIVQKFGFKPPPLSPIQLDMKSSRRVANFGRAIGVSLGCLLGMLPLWFLPTTKKREGAGQTAEVPSAEEEGEILTPTTG